ncbi:hypothetical protein CDAR_122471 [Caerostris darwini]|uniref:Uncharacterized protein n=1 Tax=Caerostris darwini TaxID=1538125 RepID=A0AAV4M8Z1_9ARAC|nr:hypothetical protein CDAR_122471 [Caerostris darwini]
MTVCRAYGITENYSLSNKYPDRYGAASSAVRGRGQERKGAMRSALGSATECRVRGRPTVKKRAGLS